MAGSKDKISHRKEDIQVRERLPVMLKVVVVHPFEHPPPLQPASLRDMHAEVEILVGHLIQEETRHEAGDGSETY